MDETFDAVAVEHLIYHRSTGECAVRSRARPARARAPAHGRELHTGAEASGRGSGHAPPDQCAARPGTALSHRGLELALPSTLVRSHEPAW